MNGWDFEESDFWYQMNPEQIRFDAEYNGNKVCIRCIC